MTETAIGYGRKSFDDPDNRTASVADQEMFARTYAERNGLTFVGWYGDNGITGATMERPGLQALLAALTQRKASIVIIEDVDRLSRDQEHLQYMSKLFRVHSITLHTVAAGVIDHLVLSMKGMMGEQQRMRIAYTTRRGLVGKASRGGVTGGRTLGYNRTVDPADPSRDQLGIVDAEARLVRRIFELYAGGLSLKQICATLNREGVPSPRAQEHGKYNTGVWNPSTLSGSVELGEGILNNSLYVGKRIFNRRSWVEIPNERKGFSRQPRLNPKSDWIVRDEPDLRIIDDALWQRVKQRQVEARAARDSRFASTGNPLNGAHRPLHLLSELVECGACGKPYVASGGGRWRCKGSRSATCTNGSISTTELEGRVLTGIRERLLTPTMVARFAEQLQRELDVDYRDAGTSRTALLAELSDTRSRIARIVSRIEQDADAPQALVSRLKSLEAEEADLAAKVAAVPEQTVIRLPANYGQLYTRAIAELERHLAAPEGTDARSAIRQLVSKVVVQTGDARGGKRRAIQLHGDLFEMLAFAESAGSAADKKKLPRAVGPGGVVTSVVAGTRFILNLRSQMAAVLSNSIAGNCNMPTLFRAAA